MSHVLQEPLNLTQKTKNTLKNTLNRSGRSEDEEEEETFKDGNCKRNMAKLI